MDPVSFAKDHLLPFLIEVVNTIRGVPNEVREMEAELERIQDFIHQADFKIAAEKEGGKRDTIKKKVKQLAEASFQIEDVIDEHKIHEEQQSGDLGCEALPCHAADFIKTVILRYQTARKIQIIKSLVSEIKESVDHDNDYFIRFSLEQGASSSTGNPDVTWQSLRKEPLHMKQADIVGLEAPSAELIRRLVKGRAERTVISVEGMGGLGKTTLAKKVFYSQEVIQHFNCRAWITVSQSYTVEELLRDVLKALYDGDPPQNIFSMDQSSLERKVRNNLDKKRHFIIFDDVRHDNFWDEIKFALVDDEIGSRILITTRNKEVAKNCESYVEIHEMQLLSEAESRDLFCKKAFQYKFNDGRCPPDLRDISFEIVEKCGGLPLAIVAIGGLLSGKEKTRLAWQEFSQNLSLEMEKDPKLAAITKILDISYIDLPYYLKSCFLYFGIYPEDYEITAEDLIRQWVAEGFVKHSYPKKSSEEVAEQYLRELIGRSLVQVSSFTIDGKAERCRVHDMLLDLILRKFKDLSFCHVTSEDNEPALDEIIRRLSMAADFNNLVGSIESPHLRSLYAFIVENLPEDFVMNIPTKYRLLKVLDFRMRSGRLNVPRNLGNLIHLKYLSIRGTRITSHPKLTGLPKSIGNLQNLETLDLRRTKLYDVPKEITKLRKLRHLYVDRLYWIEGEDGIGGMTSLQTLYQVIIRRDEEFRELEKLEQLRTLSVRIVWSRDQSPCFSIQQMKHLETLDISASRSVDTDIPIDLQLNCISPPRKLQRLSLKALFNKLPEWFLKLENLVELTLRACQLREDPLPSLKNISSLLSLSLYDHAYSGQALHFQYGWFLKLKELHLRIFRNLNFIGIDRGALPSLEKIHLVDMKRLKTIPTGIQHLKNLQVFQYWMMPPEFKKHISPDGDGRWIVKHVPLVQASLI